MIATQGQKFIIALSVSFLYQPLVGEQLWWEHQPETIELM